MEKKVKLICFDTAIGRGVHNLLGDHFGSCNFRIINGYVYGTYYCGIMEIRHFLRGIISSKSYRLVKLY